MDLADKLGAAYHEVSAKEGKEDIDTVRYATLRQGRKLCALLTWRLRGCPQIFTRLAVSEGAKIAERLAQKTCVNHFDEWCKIP
jgi:hypothetical protein